MFYILLKKILSTLTIVSLLVACAPGETRKLTKEERIYGPRDRQRMEDIKKGGGGILDNLLKDRASKKSQNLISIDSPMWKASLDILSSFPLLNVDSGSGLIITDWYSSEKKPSERFKITVLLLSQEIRSDSIKVAVHRQIIKKNRWVNKDIDNKKLIAIERKIIQRAIEFNS